MPWLGLIMMVGLPAAVALLVVRGADLRQWFSSKRLVGDAERTLGRSPLRAPWAKVASATVAGWAGVTVALTPLSVTLAVWAGGLAVAAGATVMVRRYSAVPRIDDATFDRALRQLLEQA